MISIDGSLGEGGGQIIRTALSMSCITKKPFQITNIRKNRPVPGLRSQHLTCVDVISRICDADVKYNYIGSEKLVFKPNDINNKDNYNIDIGTAGSVPLLIQCLLPIAFHINKEKTFNMKGGTAVKWSPTMRYLENVTIYNLKKFGLNVSIETLKEGFYPKGGGEVNLTLKPSKIKKISVNENSIKKIFGFSYASYDLQENEVAERQTRGAMDILTDFFDIKPEIVSEYHDIDSTGSAIDIFLGNGFTLGSNSIGQRGKPAELIGKETAMKLKKCFDYPLDEHMADQIIPFMGLSSEKNNCEINVPCVSEHCKTNIEIVENFLPVKFDILKNNIIKSSPSFI